MPSKWHKQCVLLSKRSKEIREQVGGHPAAIAFCRTDVVDGMNLVLDCRGCVVDEFLGQVMSTKKTLGLESTKREGTNASKDQADIFDSAVHRKTQTAGE